MRLLDDRGLRAAVVRSRVTPYCVVHGNCQAEPLRRLLSAADGFPYATVYVPPVHEMTARQAGLLRRLLPRAAAFVTQPVYNGYQGLPIGSDELTALLPATATVVRFPVHYYEGLHPFQVHVRTDGYPTPAPVCVHHDLRFLHCAGQGWDVPASQRWLASWVPPAEAVLAHARTSLALLRTREQHLDTVISDEIEPAGAGSFYTLNHPSNRLLARTAERVLAALGVPADVVPPEQPFLDSSAAPVEPGVAQALGVDASPDQAWRVDGRRYPLPELLAAHLAFYGENPRLVALGREQHAERLEAFGLR